MNPRQVTSVCLMGVLALCIAWMFSPGIQAAEFRLSERVIVQYDIYGVPHISALSDYDLFFAQGYVTARDRLWQMDYNRRLVAGRLAEILGEELIAQDFEVRRLGLHRAAEATYQAMSDEMKKLVAVYAAGVNHYINLHRDRLPREFRDLAYMPEPWHPVDSLAIPMMMFWHLSGSLDEELMLSKLVAELGSEKALDLVSGQPADPVTHITWKQASNLLPEGFGRNGFEIVANLRDFSMRQGAFRSIGSNNWVIDGQKSASGAPILANDPHLALLNPPIWYEVHLMGPGVNVIGSTFPGTPGVIIGHNEHIAWGVTNVGYDVCDLYIEKLDPEDMERYIFKGESTPFEKRTETIRYKSGNSMKEFERDILCTVHGPVVHTEDSTVYSLKWTGHEPSTEFRYLYLLNRATNVEEFREALSYYRLGAQNFIYADIDGNIFYQPTGKVPIRNGAPFLPLDGSSGEYEWMGYIPYEELPRALNPEEHFIATANARPFDLSYPYYIGYFFDMGYRARRIKDLLTEKEKLSFEDVRAIQADNYLLAAERLKPQLIRAVHDFGSALPERTTHAAKMVEDWDNRSSIDSPACTIFNKWLERIALNTLRDDLGKESYEYWAANPDIILVLLLRSETTDGLRHDWFDNSNTAVRETKQHIIVRSLQDAVDELGLMLGYDMDEWTWGKVHTTTLQHGLGTRNLSYNNGPYPRAGCNDTVDNAGFPFFERNFNSGSGPSLRMTVELTPGMEHGVNVIPGGQSGDRNSAHYQDQLLNFWLKHEVHPMLFTKEQIEGNVEHTLTLAPAE
ncbi:MAG: penicillin acylase family protein [Candidatus Abyssubacteria bacterium]